MTDEPVKAKDITPEEVDWLWRERVPRKMITVVAGPPDKGKGLCVVHIGAEVSNQKIRDRVTGKARWGQVLHSAIEDSRSLMTRPRYEAAGANLNNVHLWEFAVPEMLEALEAKMMKLHIDLAVLDPFNAHLSHGASRHGDSIRKVTTPLKGIAERTGAAIIVVEHTLKRPPKDAEPLSMIGGNSSGLVAAARMAYLFGIDPDDTDGRMLCWAKGNIRDKPQAIRFELDVKPVTVVGEMPYLLYDNELDFDPSRMFGKPVDPSRVGKHGPRPDKRAAAAEWITNQLWTVYKGKPAPAAKIIEDAKQDGMANKTLRRAAADMGIVRNPVGGGPNCTWSLPDDIVDMLKDSPPPDDDEKPEAEDDTRLTQADIDKLLSDGPVSAADVEPGGDDDDE